MTRMTNPPREPGRGRDCAGWLAIVAAYVSFIAILIVVFNWHRSAVLANHRRILESVARIEASVDEVRDFTRSVRPNIEANRRRIERVEEHVEPEPGAEGEASPE
jgi:heme exporter protein D